MSSRRLGLLAALSLAGAAAIPAAAFGGAHSAAGHVVTLKNFRFHPGILTIHLDDSVTWLWRDRDTEHNVTFRGFHSRTQLHGSYTVRFTRRGTFPYSCTIHIEQGMTGRIIVR
jgi:plastocyanin